MNIKNEQSFSEQYAIISYSHANSKEVMAELKVYDKHGICYWFDKEMKGGESYKKQFFDKLDEKNCKGIIFFINEAFLLSPNCMAEVKYFYDKYGVNNEDKFCFFVLPAGFPLSGANDRAVNIKNVKAKVSEYAFDVMKLHPEKSVDIMESMTELGKHIEWFLDIAQNGETLYGIIGNKDGYIEKNCDDGQTFKNYEIIFGHKQTGNEIFGYFPQTQFPKAHGANEIEKLCVERLFDKSKAYYAPVEWLVVREDDKSQTLLSKDLLFTVDYLSLKFPFLQGDTVKEYLQKTFKLFKQEEGDKRKVTAVKFLDSAQFKALLTRAQNTPRKKAEFLLPEPTYFAQISNRKNLQAFWLADDIENSKRVDVGLEGLSDEQAGVELYYIRPVIEVEKG